MMGQSNLTPCLNAKVDLALRRVGDGVSAKLNVRTVDKQEIRQQAFKLSDIRQRHNSVWESWKANSPLKLQSRHEHRQRGVCLFTQNRKPKPYGHMLLRFHSRFMWNREERLTSSWSCIAGSSLVCGLHRASQMSHSPHQRRQPGSEKQEICIRLHIRP